MPANTYGRQVVIPLTNKSGGSVAAGDVVIYDSTTNLSFTTTTSAASLLAAGIAQETIASNAVGRVLTAGYAALVNVNASVTRLDFGGTHTVAKQAASLGSSRLSGAFCRFLSTSATPDAYVYPVDLAGAALTNPMTTAGDIIVGGASGTPARLAAGTLGYPLVGGGAGVASAYAVAAKFHGVRVTDGNAQSVNDSTDTAMTSNDAEVYDTDAYHDTVTNNTRFTVGTGLGGYYHVGAECFFTASALGLRQVQLWKNGTTQIALWRTPLGNATNATEIQVSCDTALVATDYVECRVQQGSGGALNVFLSGFWMHLIGTT